MTIFYNAIIIGLTLIIAKKKHVLLSPSCIFYWITLFNFIALQLIFSGDMISAKVLYKITGSYYSAMPYEFNQAAFDAAIFQFFILIVIGWILTIYFSEEKTGQFELNINLPARTNKGQLLITLLLIIIVMANVIHLFSIDLSLLWRNHTYLLLENPSKIGIENGLLKIVHHLLRITGLFTAGLTMHFYFRRSYVNLLLSASLFTYSLIFMLAQNSRWASLYFLMMLLYCQITGKWNISGKVFLGTLCILTYIKVIIGRGGYDQGIVAIWSDFAKIRLDILFYNFLGIILNVVEGGVNLANAEQIAPTYAIRYKILSFSPLPSFLDGFSSILKFHEVRISRSVPLSAISEVRWFGGIFIMIFYGTIASLLLFANKAYYYSKGIFPFFISGFVCWITFTINSYPVRNSYRMILFVTLFLIIFNKLKKNVKITSTDKNKWNHKIYINQSKI